VEGRAPEGGKCDTCRKNCHVHHQSARMQPTSPPVHQTPVSSACRAHKETHPADEPLPLPAVVRIDEGGTGTARSAPASRASNTDVGSTRHLATLFRMLLGTPGHAPFPSNAPYAMTRQRRPRPPDFRRAVGITPWSRHHNQPSHASIRHSPSAQWSTYHVGDGGASTTTARCKLGECAAGGRMP